MSRLGFFDPVRNLGYLVRLLRWGLTLARECRRRRQEPRLTVAVDVGPLWESLTGIGWYLFRLLEGMAARDDLVLRLYGPDLVALPGTRGPVVSPPEGPGIDRVVHRPPAAPDVALARIAEWPIRRLGPLLVAADGNDVLFAPNYFAPRRFLLALARGTPLVATVHDLGCRRVPWAIRRETQEDLERHLDFVGSRAATLLTDSEAVRGEIIAGGIASPGRIRAVHLAPAHLVAGNDGATPSGTPDRYGLCVGTIEPRKNLELLLDAWRRLRRRLADPPALVLCGRLGWAGEPLRRELARARSEGWLVQLGYATDEELAALYRGALVVALPSWYEGFGLPALEACAAGAPVVASDLPVLREVLADGVLFAPPDRPDLWTKTLEEVIADAALRAELARRGRRRAARFDWARTADRTAAVLRAAARLP